MNRKTNNPVQKSRDLFDESTMTFGEHLEVLRRHLILALIGLVIATIACLMIGDTLIRVINQPITDALHNQGMAAAAVDDVSEFDFIDWLLVTVHLRAPKPIEEPPPTADRDEIFISVNVDDLVDSLKESKNEPLAESIAQFSEQGDANREPLRLKVQSPIFAEWREAAERTLRPVTLNVQEGFMTYLKVSLVAGLILSSPWIFYQLWLFIAAGLYPHERKHVHFYVPVALFLFLGGAVFCFYVVLPFVLRFLLNFNQQLGIVPQIRLSEWISFALMLPVMFGVSFELPLVMLLLERIQVFESRTYREKRRMAVLAIAGLSMVLTPADPMSMLAMMLPLILLYELGIIMCDMGKKRSNPFEASAA